MKKREPPSIKVLVYIPIYASAVIGGLALASTLRAKEWGIYDWQGLLLAFLLMAFLVTFVMTPLLIVQQLLEEKEER